MLSIAGLAEIAALVGDPSRAAMLMALMDGRALTAGELARAAGVTAQTASGHLGRMLEAGALATLCNRPAPGVARTLPLCVDVSRIPIKMLAGQITRYARIAIDRPGVVSYILSPSPAPNRQGTPGRGSRHLRMGGRAPRQVVAGTRICRILGSPACGTPASSATRLRLCRLAPSLAPKRQKESRNSYAEPRPE